MTPDTHPSAVNTTNWCEPIVLDLLQIGGTPKLEAERLWGEGSRAILAHIDKHPERAYSEWLITTARSRVTYAISSKITPTAASRHLFP